MRVASAFALLALSATVLSTAAAIPSTATTNTITLWPNGAPNETAGFPGPEVRRGDDGVGCGPSRQAPCDHVYNVSRPELYPYLVSNGTGGAVVIAPGGGYSDLSFSKEGEDVAALLNSFGVAAFVLKYRVPARQNLPFGFAPLQDAQRAIGIVRSRAKEWGLDASKIGFLGFSAGGHLTAAISTNWRERNYSRVDAADDVSCRPSFSLFLYPWRVLLNNDKDSTKLAPELSGLDSDHPPSFFAQNADDPAALPQGTLQYSVQLLSHKAPPPTVHIYPKGGHGFGLCQTFKQFEEVCDWTEAARRFVQDQGAAPGFPKSRYAPPCQ